MSDLIRQIRENMQRLSDDELVKVVQVDYRDYSEDAIVIAKEELTLRGLRLNDRPAEIAQPIGQTAESRMPPPSSPLVLQRRRIWGAFLLVFATLFSFGVVLGLTSIFVATHMWPRGESGSLFRIPFFALVMAICLWAGLKRQPRWELILGISLFAIGLLSLIGGGSLSINPSSSMETMLAKAAMKTGFILFGIAALCFIAWLTRRLTER